MRFAIIGQKWFAAELLVRLCRRHEPAFVVPASAADRLDAQAELLGVPRVSLDEALTAALGDDQPLDLLITAHAHVRVPVALCAAARHAIGYHPSLLPLHRGRSAIDETIAAGDKLTGGTVYHLAERFDAGDVVSQDWCFVRPGEDAAGLWRRALAPIGFRLLIDLAIQP